MKRFFTLIVLLSVTMVASVATANVLVYDVKVDNSSSPPWIEYRLLDQATSVKIEIFGPLPATTVLGQIDGTIAQGYNKVMWTGTVGSTGTTEGETYGFRVIATGTEHADYTLLNDLDNQIFHFENPRGGVAINNNMESPYFSVVYTANVRTNPTASGRTMQKGIYALYPDGSDPIGAANSAVTGGVAWDASLSSPYNLTVDADGNVWIPDWSDAHSGLWRAPGDLSGNFVEVFDNTGRIASGLCGTLHGSVAGVHVVKDGANYDLYWQDEDLPSGTGPADGLRDIYKLTITPATTFPIPATTVPTLHIDENNFSSNSAWSATLGLFVNDTGGGLARDADGNWYVSNYRAVDDSPCLLKFSPDGQTLLWDSKTSGTMGAEALLGANSGFALDPNAKMIYMTKAGGFNAFSIDPMPIGDLATKITAVAVPGMTTVFRGGIEVDAAGNVYVASNINERLAIYSPPGPNEFTFEKSSLSLPGGALYLKAGTWTLYE